MIPALMPPCLPAGPRLAGFLGTINLAKEALDVSAIALAAGTLQIIDDFATPQDFR